MLVLNATYEPINVCTVRRAVVLLLKEKAEVIEHGELALHSANSTMTRPVVIRLCQLRADPARHAPPQDHPAGGVRARRLDLPVLRLALQPDRRPRDPALQGRGVELGQHRRLVRPMQPPQGRPASRVRSACGCTRQPRMPNPTVFIHVASPTIPTAWQQYLAA